MRLYTRPSFIMHIATATRALRSKQSNVGRALFYFFCLLLLVSSVGLLYLANRALLVAIPARGGVWHEGIVGTPRFINPVLAVSDADQDLTALVYSGLMKATPEGTYIPDAAERCDISEDGRTYTCTLRPNLTFHDGTPLTADDVVFTIAKAQDPALKSPQFANWNGVAVQKISDTQVSFTIKQAYAPFIENLSIGILPAHVWKGVSDEEFASSQLNTTPIGSGPYKVQTTGHAQNGTPTTYTLEAFALYALGEPYLTTLRCTFYQNEDDLVDALKQGAVEAAGGISPERLTELSKLSTARAPINRVFGVFFNQNQNEVLRDKDIRQALNNALDREALIRVVLHGYGQALQGPLPPSVIPQNTIANSSASPDAALARAKDALTTAGWQPGPDGFLVKTTGTGKNATTATLRFTLATGNVPELRAAAEYVAGVWRKLGADVALSVYDQGDLAQQVIRPRKFDALLFGEVIGREPDLFAFWDSSQRNDPGLNIAQYANPAVDTLVEQLRSSHDESLRTMLFKQFSLDIEKDVPAVFLYAPDFVYIVPNSVQGLNLGFIEEPSDRFLSVTGWHAETDYVWPFFAQHH
ncbi:MAG: peptide/nickel transport system substrate-binding protein [Patescibacteria group bacterium]|nr:peptide/nickel transport system substrate-binding protein [Patescibacteria group bacterium]